MGNGNFFLVGKIGFYALGLGFIRKKNNKLGMELRFEHNSHDGISTLGHWDVAKIRAGKWE
jgi:hypothetical protein